MSEGLPIFGKEVFDTLFMDYRASPKVQQNPLEHGAHLN